MEMGEDKLVQVAYEFKWNLDDNWLQKFFSLGFLVLFLSSSFLFHTFLIVEHKFWKTGKGAHIILSNSIPFSY